MHVVGDQRNVFRFRLLGPAHQIPAMLIHLPGPDNHAMDPAPVSYVIRINGHLGATLLGAFPQLACCQQGQETVLTGVLDQAALHGVLTEIESLGLELLEVRRGTQAAP
jgi:hypothetical protein